MKILQLLTENVNVSNLKQTPAFKKALKQPQQHIFEYQLYYSFYDNEFEEGTANAFPRKQMKSIDDVSGEKYFKNVIKKHNDVMDYHHDTIKYTPKYSVWYGWVLDEFENDDIRNDGVEGQGEARILSTAPLTEQQFNKIKNTMKKQMAKVVNSKVDQAKQNM